MCSPEEAAAWQARLIGYDRFPANHIRLESMAKYTAGQYLDRPPGFNGYPGPWPLDTATQGTDIADVSHGHGDDSARDIPRVYLKRLSGSLNS